MMPAMYAATLILHSWVRWAVILLAVLAVIRAFVAMRSKRWMPADERTVRLFTIVFDVQFLLGLVLLFALSPLTKAAIQQMDVAMRTPALRYWVVEHPFGMVVALALAHIGRARVRRAPEAKKGRIALIFFAIALILILGATPWPNTPGARPLFRFLT